jgi:BA14K-like protein
MGGFGGGHIGGFGGGGAMHVGGVGGVGAMHVSGAQARIGAGRVGSVSSGDFTRHDRGQFAHDEHRSDHDRHHGYDREFGFAAGLAAGSALGYGYGGYYDPYTYSGSYDPNYSQGYVSNAPGDDGYSDSGVSSDTDASYCVQHYSSYDPASGTYLGNDGLVHPCP